MNQIFEKYIRYTVLLGITVSIGFVISYPVVRASEDEQSPIMVDDTRVVATGVTSVIHETVVTPTEDVMLEVDARELVEADTRAPWVWEPRIGGGSGVTKRDVGGYVYLEITYGDKGTVRCNGVLIDPEWVITNAGCLTDNRKDKPREPTYINITAVVGCYGSLNGVPSWTTPECADRDALEYGTKATAMRVIEHQVYQPRTRVPYYDMTVALLKLERPVATGNGVHIVAVGDTGETVVGMSGLQVLSLGHVAQDTKSRGLQRAGYQVVNDSRCVGLEGYGRGNYFRGDIHHCGAPTPPTCSFDWGAPVIRTVNGQGVLYGILVAQSLMNGESCPKNTRSVAIDVTNREMRSWIATTIGAGRTTIARDMGGSSGYGVALARGNNRQHVVDVSGVFPQGIRIGGVTSTQLSINENGVIALGSMTSDIPSYIDLATWSGGKAPVIVAFGADGDTTGATQRPVIGGNSTGSNQVWVAQDPTRRVVVVTWDDIRPFSTNVTGARYIGNTYQAELRAQENGDVKVTLRYGVIGWTAGAGQCGASGCTQLAQIGISDGQGIIRPGVPTSKNIDFQLRLLSGKQLFFYLRNGTIYAVNRTPPARREHNPIFMWTGSESTIPVGWRRVTQFDNRFPRVLASGETVLSTGGSATHMHTSPGHTHNMTNHTHTFTLPSAVGDSGSGGNGSQPGIPANHSHGTSTSGSVSNLSVSTESVTYSEAPHTPPYYDVIFITKDDTTVIGVPPGAVAYTTYLNLLTLANGTNRTPNLQNKFMRGAPTGAGGGSTGGTTSHTHSINQDHSHSTSHQHNPVTSRTSSGFVGINSNEDDPKNNHTHTVTLNPVVLQSELNSTVTVQSGTLLPAYLDVVIGQNRTTTDLVQPGLLAFYTGNESDLPAGWRLYSKVGRFLRGASSTGATGGADTHSHGTQSHTHQLPSHSHTTPELNHVTSGGLRDSTGSTSYAKAETYHPSTTTSSFTASLSTGYTTADPASNMPEYVNVYLIEYVGN